MSDRGQGSWISKRQRPRVVAKRRALVAQVPGRLGQFRHSSGAEHRSLSNGRCSKSEPARTRQCGGSTARRPAHEMRRQHDARSLLPHPSGARAASLAHGFLPRRPSDRAGATIGLWAVLWPLGPWVVQAKCCPNSVSATCSPEACSVVFGSSWTCFLRWLLGGSWRGRNPETIIGRGSPSYSTCSFIV